MNKDWFDHHDVYKYYYKILRLLNEDNGFQFTELENSFGILSYKGYRILEVSTFNKRINLEYNNIIGSVNELDPVENKLKHEYKKFLIQNKFVKEKEIFFPITNENLYVVMRYISKVCNKIDVGFKQYFDVLEEEGLSSVSQTSYLEIEISNYYSFGKLGDLLDSYNQLYSLLNFILERDAEDIDRNCKNYKQYQRSMVVESIQVASDGLLVAVGTDIIVELIKGLVKYIMKPELDKSEYAKRRKAIDEELSTRDFINLHNEIFDVLTLLDQFHHQFDKCNDSTRVYIKNEIEVLTNKIETLQGTKHVNLLI